MYRIFYNPLSRSGKNQNVIDESKAILTKMNEEYKIESIINITDYRTFLEGIPLTDKLLIIGGDGTMNFLVNFLYGIDIKHEIYFYGAGTGNDFVRNADTTNEFILINKYLIDLPIANADGIERRFINGAGMGLDAYVCECVNKGRGKSAFQYKKNTIKGFLTYKKEDLKIIMDGEERDLKDVWLISIMNGKYQGGGMMFAPEAEIFDDYLDICLIKKYSRLKVLTLFPKIYKGKHTKYVEMIKCKEVKIISNKGSYVQLDGEVLSNVKELHIKRKG